jgi:alanyl-tRNA synthetase
MQYRSGSQIREDFLRFFETKQHRRVHSSSLVPANDPTLLFANAGMNQFKDVFLGAEQRPYTRATSSQKCVRAGGKHNDLENVGFTRRHHTFFEMLGNFSFGDYFKRDAIAFAWELLTSPEWFGIPQSRLFVTIFEGEGSVPRDAEAEALWIAAGVPPERIVAMPGKDNFWQMGDTGPCGPCSEIFFDLGLAAAEHRNPDGTPQDRPFPHDDQRYVEIWNLVFMQFDRAADGTLTPLPKPSIDTGMGLERIAAVLQGKLSNYETDLFTPLIAKAAELTNFDLTVFSPPYPISSAQVVEPGAPSSPTAPSSEKVGSQAVHDRSAQPSTLPPVEQAAVSDAQGAPSLRIIADHARAATFLIADGVLPANEGRGYVLRKILRRGIRHGRLLGQEQPFMHGMVFAVRDEMANAYPELVTNADRVSKIVVSEEQQFARTLELGSKEFDVLLAKASTINARDLAELRKRTLSDQSNLDFQQLFFPSGALFLQIGNEYRLQALISFSKDVRTSGDIYPLVVALENLRRIEGTDAFRIYETYGLPLDFMVDAARDAGIAFDMPGFEQAKEEEQARARASWKGGSQKSAALVFRDLPKTEFEGYTATRLDGARILALVKGGVGVPSLAPGESGDVVLDATSFYADSGGQVGDVGTLTAADHATVIADVSGCSKPIGGVFAHHVTARQPILVGDTIDTVVDAGIRRATMRNHTGTHLLQAALREVLGTHVKQAGSLNDRSRLRFDFSHFTQVAEPELQQVEDIINAQILANIPVQTLVDVPIDEAVNDLGATALFGEKYGDRVRVVRIGDFSIELCGGTHTEALGEIGLLKLTVESSVSSGVRRVEAITGATSLASFRRDAEVARIAAQFAGGQGSGSSDASPAEALQARLAASDDELKRLRRELDEFRLKSASASTANAAQTAIDVAGIKLLAHRVEGVDKTQLRTLVDDLRLKLGSGVVVLGTTADGKVSLVAGVTKDLTARMQAGKLIAQLAPIVGGKGGGRPDLAEAGGNDPGSLDAALAKAPEILRALLG